MAQFLCADYPHTVRQIEDPGIEIRDAPVPFYKVYGTVLRMLGEDLHQPAIQFGTVLRRDPEELLQGVLRSGTAFAEEVPTDPVLR